MLTELSDMELALVAGGVTGSLGSDVQRLVTDAANGASKATLISDGRAVRSDLQGHVSGPIALI